MAFYIDALDFENATAVFSDSLLITKAPDQFYSDGVISREQSGGVLLPPSSCSGTICPVPVPLSLSVNETADIINFSVDVTNSAGGYTLVELQPTTEIVGIRAFFDGFHNELRNYGNFGIIQAGLSSKHTVVGDTVNDCGVQGSTTVISGENVDVLKYDGTDFVATDYETAVINPSDTFITAGPIPTYQLIIPKTSTYSKVDISLVSPCGGAAVYDIDISFRSSNGDIQASTVDGSSIGACARPLSQFIYQVPNAVDGVVGTAKVYDTMFQDSQFSIPLPTGWYKVGSPGNHSIYVNSYGIVEQVVLC